LNWGHGKAHVLTTAAMLADCTFQLPLGPFAPFARAPWVGTVADPSISGHLRELGGDFVCLPFGRARAIPEGPVDWAKVLTVNETGVIHGPAADAEWTVESATTREITLSLPYPEASSIARLTRSIAARENAPALDLSLTIHARKAASVSVGLHPILRLPEQPGRLHLSADFAFGLTRPGQTPSGIAQDFAALSQVFRAGGAIDMSYVPLTPKTDLNVQLCGMLGPMTATYLDEGAGLTIDWDRSLLPSLQIWHTDGGIGGAPWYHQFRGIGLEPVCAAFDLGDWAATSANPIAARGVPTALAIMPDRPITIRYSLTAFPT
jgi:galactose mutarotase-like enzyme